MSVSYEYVCVNKGKDENRTAGRCQISSHTGWSCVQLLQSKIFLRLVEVIFGKHTRNYFISQDFTFKLSALIQVMSFSGKKISICGEAKVICINV